MHVFFNFIGWPATLLQEDKGCVRRWTIGMIAVLAMII